MCLVDECFRCLQYALSTIQYNSWDESKYCTRRLALGVLRASPVKASIVEITLLVRERRAVSVGALLILFLFLVLVPIFEEANKDRVQDTRYTDEIQGRGSCDTSATFSVPEKTHACTNQTQQHPRSPSARACARSLLSPAVLPTPPPCRSLFRHRPLRIIPWRPQSPLVLLQQPARKTPARFQRSARDGGVQQAGRTASGWDRGDRGVKGETVGMAAEETGIGGGRFVSGGALPGEGTRTKHSGQDGPKFNPYQQQRQQQHRHHQRQQHQRQHQQQPKERSTAATKRMSSRKNAPEADTWRKHRSVAAALNATTNSDNTGRNASAINTTAAPAPVNPATSWPVHMFGAESGGSGGGGGVGSGRKERRAGGFGEEPAPVAGTSTGWAADLHAASPIPPFPATSWA